MAALDDGPLTIISALAIGGFLFTTVGSPRRSTMNRSLFFTANSIIWPKNSNASRHLARVLDKAALAEAPGLLPRSDRHGTVLSAAAALAAAFEAVRKSPGTQMPGCIGILRASRRARRALLSMRWAYDKIKELLILRRPRSGRLEGRTAPIQPIVDFLTASFAGGTLAYVTGSSQPGRRGRRGSRQTGRALL